MEDRIAWLAAGVIFLGIIALHDAKAAPPVPPMAMAPAAPSEQQCANLSRYALVARSLAEAKVDKPTARGVLQRMVRTDDRGHLLAALVLDHAYREKSYAGVFATQFEEACLGKRRPSILDTDGLRSSGPRAM
jgi:hypothetical protein